MIPEDRPAESPDDEQAPTDSEQGEGVGPAEDLEEDPAYSPEGPEKQIKGG